MTAFQPFAISKFETGQFQYLQPWISPDDAFNPLVNAYSFRGQLTKRLGRNIVGTTGRMVYTNNEKAAVGTGATTASGTLANFPLMTTGFQIEAEETGPVFEIFTDSGGGVLVGNLGGSGAINYTTGVWSITGNGDIITGTPVIVTYTFVTNSTNAQPIMLLTEFTNELTDTQIIIANDTRRSSYFDSNTDSFVPISTFSQLIWQGNASSTSFTFSTFGWTNIAPFSISITDGTSTITDIPGTYPNGTFTTSGNFTTGSTIDYATGAIAINFTSAPATSVLITISGSLQGNYYSGTRANLFNSTNWKPSDSLPGLLYMTNNVDPVTTYDGTNLSRVAYGITLAHVIAYVNDIKTCLDVKVFQNSLLFIRPTLVGSSTPEGQTIRWSAVSNPTNFAADVIGNGGSISISTSDWIQSVAFLRDAMVCDADNSTFLFRYTGNTQLPFAYVKINSTKSTNAPYGTVEYDTRVTSMGSKGLCYCDGVNKERYDLDVIDLYQDLDNDNFAICQGRRFDQIQQTWMIYPSIERSASNVNCDKVLVYNWLEETWATYIMNLTCIGSARTFNDSVWTDFNGMTWEQAFPPGTTWDVNFSQALIPWMLGGDSQGVIYFLNYESATDFDYTVNPDAPSTIPPTQYQALIPAQVVSKRWNPFVQQGEKACFGWVDFYYQVNTEITLTLNFYLNSSDNWSLQKTMTLDGIIPDGATITNEQYTWKRVYTHMTGEFMRLEILSTDQYGQQGQFNIAGIILWARPAGRLVPGTFL